MDYWNNKLIINPLNIKTMNLKREQKDNDISCVISAHSNISGAFLKLSSSDLYHRIVRIFL